MMQSPLVFDFKQKFLAHEGGDSIMAKKVCCSGKLELYVKPDTTRT